MKEKTRKILFWVMVPLLLAAFVIGVILGVTDKKQPVVEQEVVLVDSITVDSTLVDDTTTITEIEFLDTTVTE